MASPSDGPLKRFIREIHRRSLWQVLGIYLVASGAVLGGVGTLGDVLRLPDWFSPLAFALLIVGLPIVLATAFVQEGGPRRRAGNVEAAGPDSLRSVTSSLFTWRKTFTGGVLAFALLGFVGTGWILFGGGLAGPGSVDTTPPVGATQRLVVIPLENLTDDPDLDVLGRLAADQMARAIDRPRPVPVVPSTTVATTIRSLGGDPSVEAVAAAVQATHAFAGTVARVGDQLRFEAELIDARTSERLRTLDPVTGPEDAADSLAAVLASRAATAAVVLFDPAAPPWVGDMSMPVSIAAFQAFTEQSDIFCTGDNLGSIEPGMRAVELSPRFVAAIYQLMQAQSNLGNEFEADSLVAVLEGLRSEMTRNEELSFDWMIGSRNGDPARAERAIEEAYRLDPVGRGGSAMLTAWPRGRMNDAIERLSQLDLDGPCPWPGYWIQGSIAYHALGRYDEELGLIRHGLANYARLRSMLDVEARALVGLGRVDAVDSLLQVVAGLPPANSDQNLRAVYAALELRAHGFAERAEDLMSGTLDAWTVNRPPGEDRWNHARALYWAGRWGDALPMLQSLVDDSPDDIGYLNVYGATLARLGRRADALAMSDRLGQLGDRQGAHYWGRGMIAAVLGEQDDAVRFLNLGFDNGQAHNNFIHLDPTFDDMRSYAPFEALMRPL